MCFYTTIFPYPSTNDFAGTVLMGKDVLLRPWGNG